MENLIGCDFQGWPIKKLTLKEILLQLGGVEKDGGIFLDKKLDMIPILLEDDGMGYGVDPQYITGVDVRENRINIWRESHMCGKLDSCKDCNYKDL